MSTVQGLRVVVTPGQEDIERLIRGQGHTVQAAAEVEAVQAGEVDVVVLDADAVGDPFSLARDLRDSALRRKPMVVALGGSDDTTCDACLRAAGIDLVLYKPVDPVLLIGFLRRLQAVFAEFEAFDPVI